MAQPSASLPRYQAHLNAKGRRPPARPHWWRTNRLRQHRPVRPDQLAEVWDLWLQAHDGDVAAALGALVARHLDQGGVG